MKNKNTLEIIAQHHLAEGSPTRASDPDPWELGDELVEEEDYSQAEAW